MEVGASLDRASTAPGSAFRCSPRSKARTTRRATTFPYIGGDATYAIIPAVYIEQGNVLLYEGDAFFAASLSEPLSCVIGAVHACYHTDAGRIHA